MSFPFLRASLLVLGTAALLLACAATESTECYPSDYRACPCDNGVRGLQECSMTGDGYGACDCSGNLPGESIEPADATADAAADANDGGLLPFFAACTTNTQCETGLCFLFNAKGSQCSKACKVTTDCPNPPNLGCNMKGVCKAP